MSTIDPTNPAPFMDGVQTATYADSADPGSEQREAADVMKWMREIKAARKHDEQARKDYATARRYAAGVVGQFEVTVPIAQSYIDVLQSFIYASDPAVDCVPSGLTEPPPQKEIESMLLAQDQQAAQQQQQQQAQAAQVGKAAVSQAVNDPQAAGPIRQLLSRIMGPGQSGNVPPAGAAPMGAGSQPASPSASLPPTPGIPRVAPTPEADPGTPGSTLTPDQVLQQRVTDLLAPYQKKRDDAKQLSETLEIVITACWEKAMLKARAKLMVKSALTNGPGWMKCMWLEREGKDPIVNQEIDDVREQLARIAAQREDINNDSVADLDAAKANLQQLMEGLESKVDVVIARGMAIDFVACEDMQVSTDVPSLQHYRDAGWIAQRVFMSVTQAKADYPKINDKISEATFYHPKKPTNIQKDDAGMITEVTAEEADQYTKGQGDSESSDGGAYAIQPTSTATQVAEPESFVCAWEIWHRTAGVVLTIIEGMKCYAAEPMAPKPSSTRGHPFFMYGIGFVDGRRHPISLVMRSARLFDEYNRTRSAFARHRRRCIPKTVYDRTNWEASQISRLEGATQAEMVGLAPVRPGENISSSFASMSYPAIDAALYDTGPIRAELEIIWGIQEALSSSIQTAKTATESEIQQAGTKSRIGYMVDDADAVFADMANYCGEILLQAMSTEDVEEIAGPWALWPQGMSIQDMSSLVTIGIHGGSSGKPDTTAERQAWAQLMPMIAQNITQIGHLRGSSNEEVADCLEALVEETVRRSGDRVDARNFLPDPPRNPPPPPPPPIPPPLMDTALMGPQTAALEQVLASVKGGLLTGPAAIALIQAAYPQVPMNLVTAMVAGSTPQPNDPATELNSTHIQTRDPVTAQSPPGMPINPAAAAASAGAPP
jgi:hypothetical protein